MSHPVYTPAEARSRETFLALMWALSYPGRSYSLPVAEHAPEDSLFGAIAETLLDLETRAFTTEASLLPLLTHTGARILGAAEAAYHFYPRLDAAALDAVAHASVGTMLYPDEAATLIIGGCVFGEGETRLSLTGPGISGTAHLTLGNLPAAFWALRARVARFPLGWDVYLLAGRQVIGLPRSTQVEIG